MRHVKHLSSLLMAAAVAFGAPAGAEGPKGQDKHQAKPGKDWGERGKHRRLGRGARARAQLDGKQNVVLVFDSSRSMRDKLGDATRIQVAQRAVAELLAGWDPDIHLGLTAYGHESDKSCSDIDALVPVSRVEPGKIIAEVNQLQPRGMTPITSALEDAAQQLRYAKNKATIILVSDGLENCKRDPCKRAKELEKMGRDLTVHVVGFGIDDSKGEKQLACIAESTGGQYKAAKDAPSLREAFGAVLATVKKEKDRPLPPAPVAAPAPAPSAPPAAKEPPGLVSAQVDFSVHCCAAPPTEDNRVSETVSAVVSSAVEFPAISRLGNTVIPADIDMTNDTIDIRYTRGMSSSGGKFNGYVFEFASDGFPAITSAVLDPASTFTPEQVKVTFDDSTVFVNLPGLSITNKSRIFVRLAFAR
jgi:hypothetical protein